LEQVVERYRTSVRPRAFKRVSPPAANPVLWIPISQAGGGKSTRALQTAHELLADGGCVLVEGDSLRANNPGLFRKVWEEQLRLKILDPEAQLWSRQLVLDTIERGYHLVAPNRLQNVNSLWLLPLANPTLAEMPGLVEEVGLPQILTLTERAGLNQEARVTGAARHRYQIVFDVIACNNSATYLAVNQRELRQMKNLGMARRIAAPAKHRETCERIPKILQWAEDRGVADRFIVRTHNEVLYDSDIESSPGGATAAWKAEHERPWTTEQCYSHAQSWLEVVRTMAHLVASNLSDPRAAVLAAMLKTARCAALADIFRLFPKEEGCGYFPELAAAYAELPKNRGLTRFPPQSDSPEEVMARRIEEGYLAETRAITHKFSGHQRR
jgi:hypothetical protein